ncbi:MAG: hypothetical protein AB8H79_10755 [Myxococcota bacterium]
MHRALLPLLVPALAIVAPIADAAEPNVVTTVKDDQGWRLQVDGEDTFMFGMNWGYVPVGTNYSYDFWTEDDAFIETVLRREMAQLRGMGVNTIRQYPTIPPKWVEWIHAEFGIYTLVNPLVGRYGANVDGAFIPRTNYADPRTREVLIEETLEVVNRYKGTRGVIGFMLGNEANYGLEWDSFEIQALPKGDRNRAKAVHLYSLYGEITDEIHKVDTIHPVSICNGDVQFLDLIAEHAPNIDLFGTNVYRGRTARDLYDQVAKVLDKPIFYSEFGADAYDAKAGREDHLTQAGYFRDQWEHVYLHSWSNGDPGNAIGGYIFQWSDGWWKYKQEENLDVHDTNASWPNNAYPEDLAEGKNNMNEEWFGITAKVPPAPDGHFEVQPRSAYFLLAEAFKLDPYAPTTNAETIKQHFGKLDPADYGADVAAFRALAAVTAKRVELTTARIDLSMTSAMGTYKNGSGPLNANLDHTESVYLGATVRPTDNLSAEAIVNVLGNVSRNPIDNIRYENRGNRSSADDDIDPIDLNRVALYGVNMSWSQDNFDAKGFYRTGHYHWGEEGDFFGLYPEANYGPNLDTYNGIAPIGVEVAGKNKLAGLGMAIGPQLWWGANPAALLRASRTIGGAKFTLVHHEDLATTSGVQTSAAVSEQVTRRSALAMAFTKRSWTVEAAGLFSGSNKIGQDFTYTTDAEEGDPSYQNSGKNVIEDVVRLQDTFGGKVRLSRLNSRVRMMAEAGYQGLVADGGWDGRLQNLGWTLTPVGRGNHWHANAGVFLPLGNLQIAPNVLVQQPLVGPNTPIGDSFDGENNWYYPGVGARNFRDDPFAVLENRETYAAELLLVYDPKPGSYWFAWDNVARETANFAASLDIVYRHQPTARDASFGFTGDGVLFAFPGSPPASDEWVVNGRMIFNAGATRLQIRPYVGQQQARGIDSRLVTRGGADFDAWYKTLAVQAFVRINDWGPYDFHRDFNFTFPVQTMLDFSGGVGRANPFIPNTRFGIRGKWRQLGEFSPVGNFDINPGIGNADGWEGEVFTYVRVMR